MLAGSWKKNKNQLNRPSISYQSGPHPKQKPEITTKSPIRFQNSPFFSPLNHQCSPPLPLHLVQLTLAAPIHPTGAGRFANQLSVFAIVLLCGVCMYVTMICIQLHQVGCNPKQPGALFSLLHSVFTTMSRQNIPHLQRHTSLFLCHFQRSKVEFQMSQRNLSEAIPIYQNNSI